MGSIALAALTAATSMRALGVFAGVLVSAALFELVYPRMTGRSFDAIRKG